MISSRGAALGAVLLLAGAVACAPRRPPAKAPFVAAWVGAESAPLAAAELGRLEAAGARELFLEAAAVEGGSGAPRLVARPAPPLPRGATATLVVAGAWPATGERPAATARAWAPAIATVEADAERRGARPVGLHLALPSAGIEEPLLELVEALRAELGPRLHLSVELDPARLATREAGELSRAADYVVVFAYGQPPGEPEVTERWDPQWLRARVAELEALAVPYALGAWTLGGAQKRGPDGAVIERATALDVGELVRAPGLEPKPGAVFEGLGRQVIERVARSPSRVGGWSLARGESVRVARPTTADLERFLAAAAPAAGSRRLGAVLRRLPAAGETLSLSAASLAAAIAPGDAEPALAVRLAGEPAPAGRTRFRVVLENPTPEATDFGALGSNFLELVLVRGVVGSAEPGDFDGVEQSRDGQTRTVRALREADTLRLFAAYVAPGQRITSGTIEVRGGAGTDRVKVSGTFILPGGRELVLPVRELAIGGQAR